MLLEDVAAIAGLGIAATCMGISYYTGEKTTRVWLREQTVRKTLTRGGGAEAWGITQFSV